MGVRKLKLAAVLLLGGLLGFGVATYRNFLPGQAAVAQEKKTEPSQHLLATGDNRHRAGDAAARRAAVPWKDRQDRGRVGSVLAAASHRSDRLAECPLHCARRRGLRGPRLLRLAGLQDSAPGQAG